MAKREDVIILKVKENIIKNNLIENNDKIVLGLSGGPDSVFLLYVLQYIKKDLKTKYNINYDIIVCHINHMIREESDLDENLSKKYAEKYNLEFYSLKSDVKSIAKVKKISEEECGRDVRYEFFENMLKKCNADKIAVAHNANDNAETIIHNFFRGTGLNGLVGIKPKNGKVIRPILNIQKNEILEYLNKNGIEYNIDRTNTELIYTRNRIRNDLIPKIEKEYNPNIIESLNRMANKIKEDLKLINEISQDKYNKMVIYKDKNSIKLNVKEFKEEKTAIKNRIVLLFIKELLGNNKGIESIHVKEISDLLDKSVTGKRFSIGNKFSIIIEKNKTAKIYKNDVKI